MKLTTRATRAAIFTMAMMAVMPGVSKAAQREATAGRIVTVYCNNDRVTPVPIEIQAQELASKMFAIIGVKLAWRADRPSKTTDGVIAIELATGTPDRLLPGALAYAQAFEGIHIRIFWDRIKDYPLPAGVLGHVMVHEITHILQGNSDHSEEGIMKARWTEAEMRSMATKPLRFTADDVEAIFSGIDTRDARLLKHSIQGTDLTVR